MPPDPPVGSTFDATLTMHFKALTVEGSLQNPLITSTVLNRSYALFCGCWSEAREPFFLQMEGTNVGHIRGPKAGRSASEPPSTTTSRGSVWVGGWVGRPELHRIPVTKQWLDGVPLKGVRVLSDVMVALCVECMCSATCVVSIALFCRRMGHIGIQWVGQLWIVPWPFGPPRLSWAVLEERGGGATRA